MNQTTVEAIAEAIPDGTLLGLPADYSGVPMAVTRALIARGVRDLRLYCLPLTTIQGDMLIGAGCVAQIEAAAVTLGEYGLAPRFSAAIQDGSLEILDSTCPALHAQLQAVEKGVPFMPLRGLLGSDLMANRPDWRVIDNPMGDGDPIVLLPARPLDVVVFHAPYADQEGNVFIGRRRELATLAHAAKRCFVTVERFVEGSLFDDETLAAGALPGFYVEALAQAERGAWPCGLSDLYAPDGEELARYAQAAKTAEGFAGYLAQASRTAAAA
ncbi:MAG: CoA transferase [Pseudomonadota bacterium]